MGRPGWLEFRELAEVLECITRAETTRTGRTPAAPPGAQSMLLCRRKKKQTTPRVYAASVSLDAVLKQNPQLFNVRRKIHKVRQRDGAGCAIACVAMVAGVTYAKARQVWLDRCAGHWPEREGLTTPEILFLLRELGVNDVPLIDAPAILFIDGDPEHAVVVTRKGKILNPGK